MSHLELPAHDSNTTSTIEHMSNMMMQGVGTIGSVCWRCKGMVRFETR